MLEMALDGRQSAFKSRHAQSGASMVERCSIVFYFVATSACCAGYMASQCVDASRANKTPLELVERGSLACLGLMAYYLVISVVMCVFCDGQRESKGLAIYTGVVDGGPPAQGQPRLTMSSVWSLVYGLGISFFITAYSLSSSMMMPMYSWMLGLLACMVQDVCVTAPAQDGMSTRDRAVQWAVLYVSIAAFIIVMSESDDEFVFLFNARWATVSVVAALPVVSTMLLGVIRSVNEYYIRDVLALCEFGMPAMFLYAVTFFVASGISPGEILTNSTVTSVNITILNNTTVLPRLDLVATVVLGPVFLSGIFVTLTAAVMRGHTVDVLLPMGLVFCGARGVTHGWSWQVGTSVGLVLACMAARVALLDVRQRAAKDVRMDAGMSSADLCDLEDNEIPD